MRIYITDKDEIRKITLKELDNARDEWVNGGADIFGDLAGDTMSRDFPAGDGIDADCAMTDAEYHETVSWWGSECDRYNRRDPLCWFVKFGDAGAEYEKGHDMILIAD